MTEDPTPLDRAHAAMEAAPEDATLRLRFYEALVEAELILWLAADPAPGADPAPALFDTEDGRLALSFDNEARLAAFTGAPAPYAALPGRALVQMLAGQGIGLGLNLGVAPSSFLLGAEAIDWLAETLAVAPEPMQSRPVHLAPPRLPPEVIAALDRKLARAAGLASHALLAEARWSDGREGHLLALVGAVAGAEQALAQALGEALIFSGQEATVLDVAFLAENDALTGRLAGQALRFDLPSGAQPETDAPGPQPPGSDPNRPPRLR
ncbi:SseB family protein [Frigidibacter sp. ROC022]|uniref:SseB family protein n=1 Tax=Frigidibacter sp. ROC022 TaxID=2971796 RepID=UPI00215B2FEC|nr:SseB family protein [Frigidibacter sp. ROC022]MCR8725896.1 SseB family protein [Frigidibacter sp. ROC022]